MNSLAAILNYINSNIYAPSSLTIIDVKEEPQKSEYAASIFKLATQLTIKTVRFRVAKITATKVGQFVSFWEKNSSGVNQAYQAPDLLVITVFEKINFKNHGSFGQFDFPKNILLEKNILKSSTTKGKMGLRVYPSWDKPTSATAIKTQQWQLDYFFAVTDIDVLPIEEIATLYK